LYLKFIFNTFTFSPRCSLARFPYKKRSI
jgi:hypothetical protein